MICLETNKVCSNTNKKCKECALDDCKKAMKAIEEDMKKRELSKEAKLRANLLIEYPDCLNCTLREKTDIDDKKLRCFYMQKKGCVLK